MLEWNESLIDDNSNINFLILGRVKIHIFTQNDSWKNKKQNKQTNKQQTNDFVNDDIKVLQKAYTYFPSEIVFATKWTKSPTDYNRLL